MRLVLAALVAAFGVAAHAATGKAPASALVAPPLPLESARVDDDAYRRAYGSRSGRDFDARLAADLDAAMSGDACDSLLPLADALAREEPQRLAPHLVRLRCALRRNDGVDITTALRTAFVAALAAAERPSAEFHPDRVVAVASLVDAYVYLVAKNAAIAASTFEIAGGGRRLYFVVATREADGERQSVVRFDLAALMTATLAQLDAGRREYPDLPALDFARLLATQDDLRARAQVAIALFAASFPGRSLADPALRGALERLATDTTNPDVHHAALWLAYALLADGDAAAQARAAELARVAAARLADGDVLLAALADKGAGVPRSRRERDAALERAARRIGLPAARYRLAQAFSRAGLADAQRSAEWLRKAADDGDATAQWQYGASLCFAPGAMASRCDLAWFERASKQGATTATRMLGRAYLTGTGAPRDAARARGHYEAALAAGDENAAATLGEIHANGDAVARDRGRAVALFRRGAKYGDPRAQASLAAALRDGDGVAADVAESLRWFVASAQQGERRGFVGWARAIEEGRGTEKDEPRARAIYAWAADAGDRDAMRRLAAMLRDGRGGAADAAQADAWLEKAARIGAGQVRP